MQKKSPGVGPGQQIVFDLWFVEARVAVKQ